MSIIVHPTYHTCMSIELEWLRQVSRLARSDHPLRALSAAYQKKHEKSCPRAFTQVDSQKVVRTSSPSECASLAVDCRTIHQAKSGVVEFQHGQVDKSQKKPLKTETLLYTIWLFNIAMENPL